MEAQQDHRNRDDLGDHFRLAKLAGLDGVAFGGGDTPQSRDGELTADNQDHHPGRNSVNLDQGHQCG